jgi:hypothetical protein
VDALPAGERERWADIGRSMKRHKTLVALVACVLTACGGAELASRRVTVRNIAHVSLGMSQDEVVATLGPPFSVEPEPYQASDAQVMNYSRPAKNARWYPMLWVHLRGGAVAEVYAKRYVWWGTDDEGIYLLSPKHPHPDATGLTKAFPE